MPASTVEAERFRAADAPTRDDGPPRPAWIANRTAPRAHSGAVPRPDPRGDERNPTVANPGDRSRDPTPHHALNNPVGDPDPTEWPDPYEYRKDPLDAADTDDELRSGPPHPPPGTTRHQRAAPGRGSPG
jgi:hypothetical protein